MEMANAGQFTVKYAPSFINDEHVNPYMRIQFSSELLLGSCLQNDDTGGCAPIILSSCVTVTLPRVLLPSPIPPLTCNASRISFGKPVPVLVLKPSKENGKIVRSTCDDSIEIALITQEKYDRNVFVSMIWKKNIADAIRWVCSMLRPKSQGKLHCVLCHILAEKSKVNLRLQVATYFLFVLLLSLVLFAVLKGKPHKAGVKMFVT